MSEIEGFRIKYPGLEIGDLASGWIYFGFSDIFPEADLAWHPHYLLVSSISITPEFAGDAERLIALIGEIIENRQLRSTLSLSGFIISDPDTITPSTDSQRGIAWQIAPLLKNRKVVGSIDTVMGLNSQEPIC